MSLRSLQERYRWFMLPVAVFEFLITPSRWACLFGRAAHGLTLFLAPDTTRLGQALVRVVDAGSPLRTWFLRRSSALRWLDWQARKWFWAFVWAFAVGIQRWPRRAPMPREEKPIRLLPAPETYADFQSPALVVPSFVPCAEQSLLTNLSVQVVHVLQDIYPITATLQREAPADPRERLRQAYSPLYRVVRTPPVWHDDLVEATRQGNLLGALAAGGPFAKLLERVGDSNAYKIDLSHMSRYPVRDGLLSLGCTIHFAAPGGSLQVTGVEHDGTNVRSDDAKWGIAERVALAALLTHLTVWRQGMEYHVGGLAPVPVLTHNLLPPDHPLRRLLAAHTAQTILTNYSTHLTLRRNGFDVRGFAFPYDVLLRYYDDGARDFDIRRLDVASDARRRGITDSLDYPYLPQAMRYWELVRSYVAGYVEHHYANDGAVAADVPAQLWFEALDRYLRGGVRGYAPTLDRDNLVRLCTLIIYSLSVGHTENSLWHYAPFMPTTVRADGAQQSVGEAQLTLNFQFLICSPTTLLLDDMSHLALDSGAAAVMRQFHDSLGALQREMAGGPDHYWHLHPREIEAAVSA